MADPIDDAYNQPFHMDGSTDDIMRIIEDRLTAKQWETLSLRLQGLSYDEIASASGISRKAAARRLERARKKIKSIL